MRLRLRLVLLTLLLLLISSVGASCASPSQDFDASLHAIVKPYRFSIAQWELGALSNQLDQAFSGKNRNLDINTSMVTDYFAAVDDIKSLTFEMKRLNAGHEQVAADSLQTELDELEQHKEALNAVVEGIIAGQIRETLIQQGIYHPADRYVGIKVGFPPINFKLEQPPHLLVVSPRDRIESIREILLLQEMDTEQMEQVEAAVDEMNVASLVVGLGGFGGTYPTFVTNEASLQFAIDAATEEWLHQYLFFKPLGFRYALDILGISPDYEIATMNETVAGMVSKEIGTLVMENYYPELVAIDEQPETHISEFDREMREIRKTVDQYLADGEIERAEEFMEERRQYLASLGYYLRKLNQAYFAFYGAYADRPASISPIGEELKELRQRSASLKDFLETASSMSSRQDLRDYLDEIR